MKFKFLILILLGFYVYKLSYSYEESQKISDEDLAEELMEHGRQPANKRDSSFRKSPNLNQTLHSLVEDDYEGDFAIRGDGQDFDDHKNNRKTSGISKERFIEAFENIPLDDLHGRLMNLSSFKCQTSEEKRFLMDYLNEEFENQVGRDATISRKDYLFQLQRLYLAHVEMPDEAEKTMSRWLKETSGDMELHDALKRNFLRDFPQFDASVERESQSFEKIDDEIREEEIHEHQDETIND
jgi:hypothetical protein